jgi:hypothetical protein
MLQRHSSRRNRLDHTVLAQRLEGAVSYDRIAGYFRSSLFEVAGEAIAKRGRAGAHHLQFGLDPQDLITAAAAQAALRRSWCSGKPEEAPPAALPRYRALYDALISKKMEVRVLPDSAFGLIHGKAGVVRYADGSATAFLGSVNESASAWKVNYELLWEDDDPERLHGCRRSSTRCGTMPAPWIWRAARSLRRMCSASFHASVIEPADLKPSPTRPMPLPLPLSKRRSIGVSRGCGRTRSTSPGWRWNGTGWVARAWCWPIRWAGKTSSLRWLHADGAG